MRAIRQSLFVAATLMVLVVSGRVEANPFKHEDPKWHLVLHPTYSVLQAFDGKIRRGGGIDLDAAYHLTTAFSVVVGAGYHGLARLKKAEDRILTQLVRFKVMVRYDLDVIKFRPYLAVGGTAVLIATGPMKDAESASVPGGTVVGANWGPQIEAGLDYRPIEWLVVGLVVDLGWLMRFSPTGGVPWPSLRTAGMHVGIYF